MIYSTDPLTWAFLPGSGPQGRAQRCPRRCTSSPNKVWGAASCDHHTEAPWRPLIVPLLPSWNPSPVPLPEGPRKKATARERPPQDGGGGCAPAGPEATVRRASWGPTVPEESVTWAEEAAVALLQTVGCSPPSPAFPPQRSSPPALLGPAPGPLPKLMRKEKERGRERSWIIQPRRAAEWLMRERRWEALKDKKLNSCFLLSCHWRLFQDAVVSEWLREDVLGNSATGETGCELLAEQFGHPFSRGPLCLVSKKESKAFTPCRKVY